MSKKIEAFGILIGIFLILLFIGLPLFWVFRCSISPPEEAWEWGLPKNPTIMNYVRIFTYRAGEIQKEWEEISLAAGAPNMLIPIRNSFTIATSTAILSTLLGMFAAYNLIRMKYRGKKFAYSIIIIAYIFPVFVLLVPLSIIFRQLGLLNTLEGVILAHLAYTLPFSIFILCGYLKNFPYEIEEAAYVDGCSRLQALIKVVFPIIAPAIVTAAMFSFILSWDDLLFPLMLINSNEKYPLPVQITFFLFGGEVLSPTFLSALIIFTALIPCIMFYLAQNYIRTGLFAGAVKA
jgi:multiple sugar transport system permease protein